MVLCVKFRNDWAIGGPVHDLDIYWDSARETSTISVKVTLDISGSPTEMGAPEISRVT